MAGVARGAASSAMTDKSLSEMAIAQALPSPAFLSPALPANAERYFERRMFTDGVLTLPDGRLLPYWGFEDPVGAPGAKPFPSPLIRLNEGETAQVRLEMRKAAALKRTTMAASGADALRVATFDTHIYQWQPRASGTWLYQCHTGSPQDFEMGLYGLLVVDPAPDVSGRQLAFKNGPAYDTEKLWILDDVDPLWHDDVRNDDLAAPAAAERAFVPQYFLVNGTANTQTLHHPDVAITAKAGEKVLIRLLNASYSLVKITIEHFHGSIVSVDGTAIDTAACPWTSWIPLQPDRPLVMATGSRHDVLIDLDPAKNPAVPGTSYKVVFEFLDVKRRTVRNAASPDRLYVGRAETTISVI
jgi:FtsP/CotA-like multicopper oxidase with cupredoxin domain